MPTIDATVGGVSSNSYETQVEANTYYDERLPLPTPWVASGNASVRALIMATRVLDAMSVPRKTLRLDSCDCQYYYTSRTWTGAPTSATQRLAWPRTGMYDANGNVIPSNVIPQMLKDAESELAGQLLIADTTLDNAVIVGGIKSVSAGSVSVSFKDDILAHVLPDAVLNLMPPSWFTDETVTPARPAEFDVVSNGSTWW
jgi:hypothetical protein